MPASEIKNQCILPLCTYTYMYSYIYIQFKVSTVRRVIYTSRKIFKFSNLRCQKGCEEIFRCRARNGLFGIFFLTSTENFIRTFSPPTLQESSVVEF